MRPKLRQIQASLGTWQGRSVIILQDPLGVGESGLAIPRSIAPILELCDGTRDISALKIALELRTGLTIPQEYIENMIAGFDEAFLLENERFAQAYQEMVTKFRSAHCRPPILAGRVYPEDPKWLEFTIREYLDAVLAEEKATSEIEHIRGVVSPHIDYKRGGAIYAQVWQRAAAAVQLADLAIILGTNHFACQKLFTLTRQHYSSPWGILNTANDVVDRLVTVLGEDEVFAEEIHHSTEHSVEMAAIWLHYFARNRNLAILPVLCGSFQKFVDGATTPIEDEEIALFVDEVNKATNNRRTIIIAAGDLAHVGPAFGDHYPVCMPEKANLLAADSTLIAAIANGDAENMYLQIKNEGDSRRICGLPPIYLALRLLGETKGELTGYDQCPADQSGTSFVSICGMVLS